MNIADATIIVGRHQAVGGEGTRTPQISSSSRYTSAAGSLQQILITLC
jgi:hypothetical protein